ncbi:homogentisate 1,2-dioxygenase [Kitasatospora sp. NPDC059812]|uniref:homogentisate 1,2-dioxygenase n=1 Tax=Kitasatospora sp. NPDC059812 TaxID=3346958 RepID=UPI00365F0F99
MNRSVSLPVRVSPRRSCTGRHRASSGKQVRRSGRETADGHQADAILDSPQPGKGTAPGRDRTARTGRPVRGHAHAAGLRRTRRLPVPAQRADRMEARGGERGKPQLRRAVAGAHRPRQCRRSPAAAVPQPPPVPPRQPAQREHALLGAQHRRGRAVLRARGHRQLLHEFGPIPYEPGDYVLVPKGVTYRIRPGGPENYFLVIESTEELGFADTGTFGRRAPFDPGLLYVPSPALDELGDGRDEDGQWPVRVKLRGERATIVFDSDPIDVEGWSGDLFPFKMNIRDYRPVMSDRIHVMPSAYAVFAASTFMVGNFLPRPFESAPDSEPFPPYHRNADYDEFTFFHNGTVLGVPVAPATMSLVPQGLHHGLPAELQEQLAKKRKPGDRIDSEVVFVDTKVPLTPTPDAEAARRTDQEAGQAGKAAPAPSAG